MKNSLILAVCVSLCSANVVAQQAKDPNVKEARKIMKAYGKSLKGHMKKAMKAGGPINALQFCNVEAPKITADSALKSGWTVRRTSLKNRNELNAPDDWERKVLEAFEAKKAEGANPKKLEHYEVVEIDGNPVFRYVKAIPAGKVCMNCHGKNIKKSVAETIKGLYPNDKATGYTMGEIRGAFSFSKSL